MQLKVHGVRMGVLTGLIPREKIIQGVIFRLDNIHGKNGNYWFQMKVDLLNQKVSIMSEPSERNYELVGNKFPYASTEKAIQFCKHMVETETNWLRALKSLDDDYQGLYAFVTKNGSHQISLSFSG